MVAAAYPQSPWKARFNRFITWVSKPQNAILLLLGIILTLTTVFPMITIVRDTVTVHNGSVDARNAEPGQTFTTFNWEDLFAGKTSTARKLATKNLWTPLLNSVLLSIFACIGAIFYGGVFAYQKNRNQEMIQRLNFALHGA